MQEILDCLTEEIARYRGIASLYDRTHYDDRRFGGDYARKAELLEKAAEIVKETAAIGPHGRLIDADAIRADIDEKRPGRSYEDAWTLTVIDAAPTIIPANMEATK